MTKVLVLYYSSYGHVEIMAEEVANGADGSRMPSEVERRIARFQRRHVAGIAKRLFGATPL